MKKRIRHYKKTIPEPAKRMLGPWPLPSIERARELAYSYVMPEVHDDGTNTRIAAEKVAQWIASTGDCVFHACHEVFGSPCYCATCRPDVKSL